MIICQKYHNLRVRACSFFFQAQSLSHTHVGAPHHVNTWNDVDGPFVGLDSLIDIGWKGNRGHVGLVVCQRNYTQTLALATFMRSCSHLPRGFGLLCAQQLLDDVRTKFFLEKEAWARQRLRRGHQAISTLSFMNSASNPNPCSDRVSNFMQTRLRALHRFVSALQLNVTSFEEVAHYPAS